MNNCLISEAKAGRWTEALQNVYNIMTLNNSFHSMKYNRLQNVENLAGKTVLQATCSVDLFFSS